VIKFSGISQSFGAKPILKNIDIALDRGKTHVLLGRSGSGKSTLLKILLGTQKPLRGEVRINGNIVSHADPREIGYVPQDGGLFPHLTNFQNVTIVAKARGWTADRIEKRFREIAPLVSMREELFSRYPREISGGESQRLAILRALFLDPPILVLDEPLSALDPIVRSNLQTDLKTLFNRLQKTVIIVTHDLAEAAYFGHSIHLLSGGDLLQSGTFEDLRDHAKHPFVTEFIQSQRALQLKDNE
jgi:osmoprotectant transport system ATP-binding protein